MTKTEPKARKARATKAERLLKEANNLVPRAQTLLGKITRLVRYSPTQDQRLQIVETVRKEFDRLEEAFTAPQTATAAKATFTLTE